MIINQIRVFQRNKRQTHEHFRSCSKPEARHQRMFPTDSSTRLYPEQHFLLGGGGSSTIRRLFLLEFVVDDRPYEELSVRAPLS